MALITCIECGKEFSDRASACPTCGCPTSESIKINENTQENANWQNDCFETKASDLSSDPSLGHKLFDFVQTGINSMVDTSKNAIRPTKQIGPVQIDEPHKMFRINGAVPVNGKKDGLVKSVFKGSMAVGTLGMSVAAEKLLGNGNKQKIGNNEWLDFSDLINYELLENDSLVTSGGVGQALIGGAIFGGFGAIAGGVTGKRVQKRKIESLYIKATVNNFGFPCIMIPLITKPIKSDSKDYQNAFSSAHQILSAFDVIVHNTK